MGQLIHVNGDLFTSDAHILAHGCNCRGGFGSGVAGIVARLYPEARKAYLEKYKTERWTLGEVQFVEIHPDRIVANLATQDTFGGLGRHVSYDAIDDCFVTLLEYAKAGAYTVAIPRIGAGLAGGSWPVIESIIREVVQHYPVDIICYTPENQ